MVLKYLKADSVAATDTRTVAVVFQKNSGASFSTALNTVFLFQGGL
jgi:hypothetical protein